MATEVDERNYRTRLDLGTLRQVVSGCLTGRIDISPLQYDALEDPDDIGVLVTRDAIFGGNAAVQVCMNDAGEH